MRDTGLREAADLLERAGAKDPIHLHGSGVVIQVNPEPTALDPVARINLYGTAAEVPPALAGM